MVLMNLDTGITEIDAIADDLSIASSDFQFILERTSIIGQPITLDFSEDMTFQCDDYP